MTPEHRRVLAHESGHALVAWFSPTCDHVAEVIARDDGTGNVASGWPAAEITPVLWERTSQCLGGLAGEFCGTGKYRAGGAQDDILKALATARTIIAKKADKDMPWPRDAVADHLPHLERAFPNGLTDKEAHVLNTSLRRAIYLIERNRDGFNRLQKKLATQRLVYGRELEEYFGNRLLTRLLNLFH